MMGLFDTLGLELFEMITFSSPNVRPFCCCNPIPGGAFLAELVMSSSFGGAEGMSFAGKVTPGGSMNLPLPIP